MGEGGARWMFDTPPNRKRVMLGTSIPWALVIREWASSCRSTDAKNTMAATSDTPHTSSGSQSRRSLGNTASARFKVTSRKV